MVNHWATWWREQMTNSNAMPVESSVLALAERRGPAVEARGLYEDLAPRAETRPA